MNSFSFYIKSNPSILRDNLNKLTNKYVFPLQNPNKTILKGIIRGRDLRSISVDNGLEMTSIILPLQYINNLKRNDTVYIKYDSKYFNDISFNKLDNFLNILVFLIIKIYLFKKKSIRGVIFNKKNLGFALGFLGLIIKLPNSCLIVKKLPCNRLWDLISFLYVGCTVKVKLESCEVNYSNITKKFNFKTLATKN